MGDLIFALVEIVVELLCMGSAGRWILLFLLSIAAVVGFGYWVHLH